MSIQHVKCPKCRTGANVPVAMATVRCPGCAHIWNPNEPESEGDQGVDAPAKKKSKGSGGNARLVRNIIGALLLVGIVGGAAWYFTQSESSGSSETLLTQQARPSARQQPVAIATPAEPYREIKLPELTRKQIYRDYRLASKTTVEKPIPLPKKWDSRAAVDATMSAVLENQITLHANINNVSNEDIAEVIKEGNAKKWK